VRNSDVAAFPLAYETPAVHALNRRLAAISATAPEQGEPLQILRYGPGQQYKAHSDALPNAANQRICTALVYLNEDYAGGETHFLANDLKVRGAVGDAILFVNADREGRPDADARHAGLPVTRGTKLLASRWIRARPLDLSMPGAAAA
jgi:prolyl 4-hydroxylase